MQPLARFRLREKEMRKRYLVFASIPVIVILLFRVNRCTFQLTAREIDGRARVRRSEIVPLSLHARTLAANRLRESTRACCDGPEQENDVRQMLSAARGRGGGGEAERGWGVAKGYTDIDIYRAP